VYFPRNLGLYTYTANRPTVVRDPNGQWLDAVLDIGFAIYDVGVLIHDEVANGGKHRAENLAALGADVMAAVIPGVTGAGLGVRAAAHADDAVRAVKGADKVVDAVRAGDHAKDAAKAAEHVPGGARATGETAHAAGAEAKEARFIGQPDGQLVDTRATPRGSYQQPNGSRTDILQREDHGAGLSHTHDPKVNVNPKTGQRFINGLEKPGRPVSVEDVKNITTGRAPPADPKGR
jgi:hypothetical protein